MSKVYRTHSCGQLNRSHVGQEVWLCGWVHARRDHGKLIFIDMRDRDGLTQVVFHPKACPQGYELALQLKDEYVIQIKGQVSLRPKGTENPKLSTGEVELAAQELIIINPSLNVPFPVAEDVQVGEELRLAYRYLDLRRPRMLNNLKYRHRFYQLLRNFLDKEGFLEVETPILTKSTPEGARDYLVPSRLNPGSFYALPQSPQLFKQLLMVAGIERYFQIAKCFRDEDLRSDRQPEFTQLDLEFSFVDEEYIFDLSERLFSQVFKELKGIELKVPFPRLTHRQALQQWGTDKPDLRKNKEDFSFVWIVEFPLFKYNEEEKRWESEHHPFTAPLEEDFAYLDSSLSKVRARSYDLVLNGNEISSGSIRIHDSALQQRVFEILGISKEEAQARFGFLLEAFRYGAPPHGGIAFGLDRLLAIMLAESSIREVIPFPKTQKATCLLTGAPSEVEPRQLKELFIKLLDKE